MICYHYHSIILCPPFLVESFGNAFQSSICHTVHYGCYAIYEKGRDKLKKMQQLHVFVHEIGHQFGLVHTDKTPSCKEPPDFVYLMRDKTTDKDKPYVWSPCSIEHMKNDRPTRYCLRMREGEKFGQPICGNGMVEDGEECDCIPNTCKKCCNNECQLTPGSNCSNGPCCDISNCTLTKGNECRAALDSCDIPELCDGNSTKCSPNYVVADGYRCKDSSAPGYCYNGRCGSHSDTCSWIFVKSVVPKDECYNKSLKGGSSPGGCGPVYPERGPIFSCGDKDRFCGKIWCKHDGPLKYTENFETARRESHKYLLLDIFSDISISEQKFSISFQNKDSSSQYLQVVVVLLW